MDPIAIGFGAKVNVLQVDGINFIEHLSYDAFNEGIRLQEGIFLQRQLFGKCTHQSADKIYATNANRSYCKQNNIVTNFIPKGRQKIRYIEQAAALTKQLNIQRGTVLEGSFGNEKNHYLLGKIPARLMLTTYFGGLCENLGLAISLRTAGLHVDAVRAPNQVAAVLNALRPDGG